MATVVAVDCTDGALLAGDRQVVEGGTVVGSRRHVFGFDTVGAAAVGDDPDGFRRQLDAAIRDYGHERGPPTVDALSRMATEIAGDAGVEVLIAARDDRGRAIVRSVTDGALDEDVAALGSAAPIVLGQLEPAADLALDAAESRVAEAFAAGAARDPGTGGDVDVWRLSDPETGETV